MAIDVPVGAGRSGGMPGVKDRFDLCSQPPHHHRLGHPVRDRRHTNDFSSHRHAAWGSPPPAPERKIGPNDIRSPSGVAFNAGHRQTLESSGFEIVVLERSAVRSSSAKRPFTQKAYPNSSRGGASCAATPGPGSHIPIPVSHKSTLRQLVGDGLVVRRVEAVMRPSVFTTHSAIRAARSSSRWGFGSSGRTATWPSSTSAGVPTMTACRALTVRQDDPARGGI